MIAEHAFHPVLALAAARGPVKVVASHAPLRDPVGDLIVAGMRDKDIWRDGADLALGRDARLIKVRLFMPERSQGDRERDREIAQRARAVVAGALRESGCGAVFTDALWCELQAKGWAVIGRGTVS